MILHLSPLTALLSACVLAKMVVWTTKRLDFTGRVFQMRMPWHEYRGNPKAWRAGSAEPSERWVCHLVGRWAVNVEDGPASIEDRRLAMVRRP